jgi:nitrous oxidase accessory protein NosD
MRPTPLLIALAAAALPTGAGAAESADACTAMLTEGATTLDAPGIYCMSEDDPDFDGSGLYITSPDVTLDCRGFARGRAGYQYQLGVWSTETATNAVVRNCEIRGYSYGVLLYGGGLVEDNLIRNSWVRAVYVDGDHSVIRRNRVVDTGAASTHTTYVISGFGDVDIVDNVIDGATVAEPDGERIIGILANDGLDPEQTFMIRGNVVRNLRPLEGQETYAVYIGSTGKLDIRDNVLFGPASTQSVGIYCLYAPDTRITGNDIYDFESPLPGCIDDADNVVR